LEFSAYDIALVPLIVLVVEVIKQAARLPSRWIPLVNIVLGQIASFVYVSPDDPKYAVLAGLVMAFSAMGLWSGTKNTLGK
jgi:hypothetical protein